MASCAFVNGFREGNLTYVSTPTRPTIRFGEAFYRARVAAIQAKIDEAGFGGFLVLNSVNVIYACGFFHVPSERPLGLYIPRVGEPRLYVPLLEQEHAAATWIGDVRVYFEYPAPEHPVLWMAREAQAERLAVDVLSYDLYKRLAAAGHHIETSPIIEHMRWIKTPEEIALTELAASYADYTLEQVRDLAGPMAREGRSELDILTACLRATQEKMAREIGDIFELFRGAVVGTVHSGPQAALPHGRPNQRVPQPGETLIAGIGANVGGYHAESGATFVLGHATPDQMRCLETTVACNDAGVAALRPGVTGAAVNAAALNVLYEAGYGPFVRHRIGHALGLQNHESPYLAPGDETIIQPGMVFSNEPGIYRPGVDGYRIINTMIVTADGVQIPSKFLAAHPPEKRVLPY